MTTTTATRTHTQPLYRLLAGKLAARITCQTRSNTEWCTRHSDAIAQIARDVLPSGSGIDNGTTVDLDSSTGEKLVLHTAFHHMDESGSYDGWTEHRITIRPSLIHGITLSIAGPNRNAIKDYLADVFSAVLLAHVTESYDVATDRSTFATEPTS